MRKSEIAKEKQFNELRDEVEIYKIYEANAPRLDLFDCLLEEEMAWADAETSAAHSQMDVQQILPGRSRHQGCKCSKIGCLKLYCQCFANGRLCTEQCQCTCCRNKPENQHQISQAKMVANQRHPGHFQDVPAMNTMRRCTCKKSMCRKKYCECFNAGVECTDFCECKDCQNGRPHSHQSPKTRESFSDAMMEEISENMLASVNAIY